LNKIHYFEALKKLLTIFLLGLLLFVWGGYRSVLTYLEVQTEDNFQAELFQNQYDEASLLHLKVAANTPYNSNSGEFENINGTIDIKGVTYHFVKRKFFKDSLELLCVPNIDKLGISNARDVFFRLAYEYDQKDASQKSSTNHTQAKFSISDFTGDHFFSWQFLNGEPKTVHYMKNKAALLVVYVNILERPPQV
jgi:hypothetical protein